MLTFCLCGGGALAHVFAGVLGANPDVTVRILTRQPARWQSVIRVLYQDEAELQGRVALVSDEPAVVVPHSDVVLLLVPAYARHSILASIQPYLGTKAWVGAVPGAGGFDWSARALLGSEARIFGLARTPFICRTKTYGASVLLTGIQDRLNIAGFPRSDLGHISNLLETALGIPIDLLSNYLAVTLTPTNSVVHPARLYGLLQGWKEGIIYENVPLFYAEWDEVASRLLMGCDREIQHICSVLPIDLSQVVPLERHYKLGENRNLTEVIRGIGPLRGIRAPFIRQGEYFIPDIQHRFFTEDIPYGLVVLRGIAEIAEVATPSIDLLLTWAQQILGLSFLTCNRLNIAGCRHLPVPQNFGINTVDTLVGKAK